MPVLDSTDHMPRSALRHRPIQDDANRQGKRPSTMTGITPVAERASLLRSKQTEENEEVSAWKRTTEDDQARSAGASAAPRAKRPRVTRRGVKHRGVLRGHPLVYLGIGMVAMLVLWTFLTMAISWWKTTSDDLHYGRPRTFQTDQFVGHSESGGIPSHFIAVNLYGRIEVIEFPGGDATHARIFLGPQLYTTGNDLIPATLTFIDVNGDHKPDMIIDVQGSKIVFINDQGTFRPLRADELHTVERYLQQHGQQLQWFSTRRTRQRGEKFLAQQRPGRN